MRHLGLLLVLFALPLGCAAGEDADRWARNNGSQDAAEAFDSTDTEDGGFSPQADSSLDSTPESDTPDASDSATTCPNNCNDGLACTIDVPNSTPQGCTCTHTEIASCVSGDQCCPAGCNAASDTDCSATCGNGVVESNETCDKAIASGSGSCPTSCDDGQSCTVDQLVGSTDNCSAACSHSPISQCVPGDGCCPAGCNATSDTDCSATCGNGVVELPETCDKAIVAGSGSCPTSCDDGQSCTVDQLVGSMDNCSAACSHSPISQCAHGDGCCPGACTSQNDSDCVCVPKTCAELGANCGTPSNGCSGLLDCGSTCPLSQVCGGGGTPFVCACQPGTWTSVPVGSEGNSNALVTSGTTVHLIYVGQYSKLMLATRVDAGAWTESEADGSTTAKSGVGMAVDASGKLHATYRSGSSLVYAAKPSSGTWTTTPVAQVGDYGGYTSVAVDSLSGVHVSYSDCTNYTVQYGYLGPGQTIWQTAQLAPPANCSLQTAIAVDTSGGVHAAFEANSYHLTYAYRPPGLPWTSAALDTSYTTSQGGEVSIAVAASGDVHVAYHAYAGGNRVLRYGYKPAGGAWGFVTVDPHSDWTGRYTSLALSHAGVPHIVHVDWTEDQVRHAWMSGTSWTSEVVSTAGLVFGDTSMAFDAAGGLHVSYSAWQGSSNGMGYSYECP